MPGLVQRWNAVCMCMPTCKDGISKRVCTCLFTSSSLESSNEVFSASLDRHVYQSGLKSTRANRPPSLSPLSRTPQPSTSLKHATHFTDEIIFHVISNAQTKLEWMQNVRKWGACGIGAISHLLTWHADTLSIKLGLSPCPLHPFTVK